MSIQFASFIKIIGAGKNAGRCLNIDEAYTAMSMLLCGHLTAEQKGAFLMLLRVREESPEELAGFTKACRDYLKNSHLANIPIDIDLPCYAGKRRQLPWYLLAIAVLHQQGYRILLHSTSEPETKRLYIKEVLNKLNLQHILQAKSAEQCKHNISKYGLAYMDLHDLHKPLNDIIQLRSVFGLRSCANTLARILNPCSATFSIQGVHHKDIDHKHINVAQLLEDKNMLCFRGEGGEPEVNPCRDTDIHYIHNGKSMNSRFVATQGWQMKPKQLQISDLLDCWVNDNSQQYPELSVLASLSAYIMLLKNVTQAEAHTLASQWWSNRDKKSIFNQQVRQTKSLAHAIQQ